MPERGDPCTQCRAAAAARTARGLPDKMAAAPRGSWGSASAPVRPAAGSWLGAGPGPAPSHVSALLTALRVRLSRGEAEGRAVPPPLGAAAGGAGCGRARPCRSRRWRNSRPSPPSIASREPARCWRPQVKEAAVPHGPVPERFPLDPAPSRCPRPSGRFHGGSERRRPPWCAAGRPQRQEALRGRSSRGAGLRRGLLGRLCSLGLRRRATGWCCAFAVGWKASRSVALRDAAGQELSGTGCLRVPLPGSRAVALGSLSWASGDRPDVGPRCCVNSPCCFGVQWHGAALRWLVVNGY